MAFNCRIRFTGLCAFVPNKALDQQPDRACVVLVDGSRADGTTIRAIDGSRLRRHRSFVLFDLKDLVGSSGHPRGQGVWYLERQRVAVDAPGSQAFQVVYTKTIDDRLEVSAVGAGEEEDLAWVAGMNKIAPDFESMDSTAVTTTPPSSVLAQVLLPTGRLRAGLIERQVWSIPKTLAPDIVHRPVAHEVVLELNNVTQLTLRASALSGGTDDSLELATTQNQTVSLTIANLCDDNPFFWSRVSPVPRVDDDFRWYFQLLTPTQQDEVDRRRRGFSLPIPHPKLDRLGSAATGINCFPVRFAPIGTGF